jgi:hypothetical protein
MRNIGKSIKSVQKLRGAGIYWDNINKFVLDTVFELVGKVARRPR